MMTKKFRGYRDDYGVLGVGGVHFAQNTLNRCTTARIVHNSELAGTYEAHSFLSSDSLKPGTDYKEEPCRRHDDEDIPMVSRRPRGTRRSALDAFYA